MKVCYFGSYLPSYPRHRIIIKGLESLGVEVCEVTDSSQILIRYPRMARKFFAQEDFDVIIVGEASNYVQPLAILLKKIINKPLVFDTYVSLYDTNKDRGVHQNPLLRKLFYYLDKYNCQYSDLVLQDTNNSAQYFEQTFNIPSSKFRRLLIGAEDDLFYPRDVTRDDDKFKVLFYGTYIPLHGIEYIIQSAKLLENENIDFQLIGNGQTFSEIKALKEDLNLSNVYFTDMVPYTDLPDYIAKSDVCLGIFGGTEKSMRVIPTKAYQILAMGKPLITGNSPGARELLVNDENAVLCDMGSAESLANSILRLKNDKKLRDRLGRNGFKLFKKSLSPEKIGEEMLGILNEVI